MSIHVEQVDYQAVKELKELYRQEANCQIIHDAFLGRDLAAPYLIHRNGQLAGYGAVGNKYPDGRVTEFYTIPAMRSFALPMYHELLAFSGATSLEAQTNIPLMLLMLYDCGTNITREALLFEDAFTTNLLPPDVLFRQATSDDAASSFEHLSEPVGEWVVEANGEVVGTGGFLTHYNPPYGDVYMEVAESARHKGYGSYLVQEVKRICHEADKKPAARCHPANFASRQTLQKAGFLPCGYLLSGDVNPSATPR